MICTFPVPVSDEGETHEVSFSMIAASTPSMLDGSFPPSTRIGRSTGTPDTYLRIADTYLHIADTYPHIVDTHPESQPHYLHRRHVPTRRGVCTLARLPYAPETTSNGRE